MKSKSYIFCFVVLVICYISAYAIGYNMGYEEESAKKRYNEANIKVAKETQVASASNTTMDDETDDYYNDDENKEINGYWIRIHNDNIVIYNSDGKLVANTEINISNFPEKDKQILYEGIYIENAESLFRHLESYTS